MSPEPAARNPAGTLEANPDSGDSIPQNRMFGIFRFHSLSPVMFSDSSTNNKRPFNIALVRNFATAATSTHLEDFFLPGWATANQNWM
jgi:hypothetical protein